MYEITIFEVFKTNLVNIIPARIWPEKLGRGGTNLYLALLKTFQP
jgi:hypothetical protein